MNLDQFLAKIVYFNLMLLSLKEHFYCFLGYLQVNCCIKFDMAKITLIQEWNPFSTSIEQNFAKLVIGKFVSFRD